MGEAHRLLLSMLAFVFRLFIPILDSPLCSNLFLTFSLWYLIWTRLLDMLLNGSAMTSRCALMDSRACKPVISHQVFACFPHLPARSASLSTWSCGGKNIFFKHFFFFLKELDSQTEALMMRYIIGWTKTYLDISYNYTESLGFFKQSLSSLSRVLLSLGE